MNYSLPPNALKGKVILITGAGDGIGRAAALHFASLAATPILLGRTLKKLESLYDQIQAEYQIESAIVPLDLRGATVRHYQDMALTIEQQFGALHGLLHNASMLGQLGPFKEITPEEYQDIMHINLHSQVYLTQALLPVLQKADNASVVFTTSSVGSKGRAFWGSYAISKFATEGMMQTLADEYAGSNLRFNCINPGATRTNMRAKAYPAEDSKKLKTPTQIMPLYGYLMADQSKHENGRTFLAQPK